MQSFQLSSHINSHGVLQIQLPQNLASQDGDVILVVQPKNTVATSPINKNQKKEVKESTTSFGAFLKQFRQEVESDPIDIEAQQFQDIIQLIEQYKHDSSGLTVFEDPQIQGLKLELKVLENRLNE